MGRDCHWVYDSYLTPFEISCSSWKGRLWNFRKLYYIGPHFNLPVCTFHSLFSTVALTHYHKGQHTYRKEDILMSGWLTKETSGGTLARPGANRKKRYFILTSNSLDYYRNVDLQQKLGAIALNSLCSVTVPDEKSMKEEGEWVDSIWQQGYFFHLENLPCSEELCEVWQIMCLCNNKYCSYM